MINEGDCNADNFYADVNDKSNNVDDEFTIFLNNNLRWQVSLILAANTQIVFRENV